MNFAAFNKSELINYSNELTWAVGLRSELPRLGGGSFETRKYRFLRCTQSKNKIFNKIK